MGALSRQGRRPYKSDQVNADTHNPVDQQQLDNLGAPALTSRNNNRIEAVF
jgi:hypothetical protein